MIASEKIGEVLKYLDINAKVFSERLGYARPQIIYDIQKGKTKVISTELANKIISVYPEISKVWLLADEGEMIKKENRDGARFLTAEEREQLDTAIAEGRVTYVPLIPASAFAGSISGYAPDATLMKNCERIVSPVFGAELAIPITGDSMEPDYPDGAIAYIKRINDDAFIPWGHTVILDTENGAFIKRIYPDDENEKYVWARSINPAYPPLHIPTASIYRMFRVLGTSRIFTTM